MTTVHLPSQSTPSTRPAVDAAEVEALYAKLLVALGQDVSSEGLRDTPARAARFWKEFLEYDPGVTDASFEHSVAGDGLVAVRGIQVWTMCEHHLLPFSCRVGIAYIPAGRVLGLSKLARIAQDFAHRLQLQERLTAQIAERAAEVTDSQAVGVWAEGEHLCMCMRGIRATGSTTVTEHLLGRPRTDPDLADRLYRAVCGAGVR